MVSIYHLIFLILLDIEMAEIQISGNSMGFNEEELANALFQLVEDVRYFMEYLSEHNCDSFEYLIDDVKMTLHRDSRYLQEPS